jgi:hypothetical protein
MVSSTIKTQNQKSLEDCITSKPKQLLLFEFTHLDALRKHQINADTRSHTIALYDFMPKYFWGKLQEKRVNGVFLTPEKRDFAYSGINYKLVISPASIEEPDGSFKHYFPGEREELVEDALRKIATEGSGLFIDDQAGVAFTIYQLQAELKKRGHTFSYDELKQALMICNATHLKLVTADGHAVLASTIFETVGMRTFEEWKGTGQKTKCFVRFNSLVTQSIRDHTYRLLNYEKAMTYKSVIARQLHKRLSHHFIYASAMKPPYNILLSTIIRDCGLKFYKQLRDNLRDVKKALDEMKEKGVIFDYRVEKTLDAKNRNKLLDAKFFIIASHSLCSEMIQANSWHGDKFRASSISWE